MAGHVESAGVGEGREVMAGMHSHWATYDEHLEGARFHRLHALVAAPAFDGAAAEACAEDLEALASSYGYGNADGHLAELARNTGDLDDERAAAREHREAYLDDPTEGDYFTSVRNSERTLLSAAATDGARAFLGADGHPASWDGAFGALHDRMERAFHVGVGQRRGDDGPEAGGTPARRP